MRNAQGGMLAPRDRSPYRSAAQVALCVGGGNDPLSEYECALALCELAGVTRTETLACNDTISLFKDRLDNAVTLHPDKLTSWLTARERKGYSDPPRVWSHLPTVHCSHHTKDWQGSSGLFMAKIAREIGLTKIILCGVPMTVEGDHIVRQVPWMASHGFRRGWVQRIPELRMYVRSMSGWTQQMLGEPTIEWLRSDIPDERPRSPDTSGIKA